ncbi:DUF4065 domain-containing protein [Rudanella paleaurantiibacter]|uniref:DUF4065 domain-containing protein n=1 Tax=Rudanella paleaurantiibacter TaxID=2614655 RepID=A0A7J5U1U6_9BACT|nr:Panacea domain-containing protein [Rudanella paleaurantiibacter]KAB7731763.1 DUF4065 domain-containing protein [Rudanella paleaurantiibacter]
MSFFENPSLVDHKTKELLIYVASKLHSRPTYGATVLNKVLYFIDCESYLRTGKPVTNFTYVKLASGPAPKPTQFLCLMNALVRSGDITEGVTERFGKTQTRHIPMRQPVLSQFDSDELVLINKVINSFCTKSAADISNMTHQLIAWKFARINEELPFFTCLLTSKPISEDDIRWAEDSISKFELMSNN